MSAEATAWAWAQKLDGKQKLVLLFFCEMADGASGEVTVKMRYIEEFCGISKRVAIRVIASLVELGLVEKARSYDGNLQAENVFRVIHPTANRSIFSRCQNRTRGEIQESSNDRMFRASRGVDFGTVEEGFNESPEQQEQPVVAPVICNSNLSNARRKKRAYLDENPPTPEEWLERAKTDPRVIETLMPLVEAEQAYDWYVAHGWCQKDGGRLVDWPALIRRWARSWKAKNPQAYIAAKRDLETAARAAQPFVSEIAQIKARQREAAARSGA